MLALAFAPMGEGDLDWVGAREAELHAHPWSRGNFADSLASMKPLEEDGLVRVEHDRIKVTGRGRLLLRNIAMCFDRYLTPAPAESDSRPRFSRAI